MLASFLGERRRVIALSPLLAVVVLESSISICRSCSPKPFHPKPKICGSPRISSRALFRCSVFGLQRTANKTDEGVS
uniref:Putative secreted protein n=1 Tax=Anopheles darlingi TaxID=43151 RepID=A0A2M4DRR6_ANODA